MGFGLVWFDLPKAARFSVFFQSYSYKTRFIHRQEATNRSLYSIPYSTSTPYSKMAERRPQVIRPTTTHKVKPYERILAVQQGEMCA